MFPNYVRPYKKNRERVKMEDLLLEYKGEECYKEIPNKWLNGSRVKLRINNDDRTSIKELKERVDNLERKLNTILQAGIQVAGIKFEPMVVPDYTDKEIKKCTEQIEEYLKDHDTIEPMKFAEEKRIEYNLVLLCIDKMISEGILEF